MKEAADLAVNGPSKAPESGKPSGKTGSASSKSDLEGPPKETWATINKIGATLHLLEAEEFHQMGDMKNLVRVAESAVTCAEKQPDKKLLAEAWIWLGTGYSRRANLKSGIEAFTRALEAIKTLNQKDKDVESMKKLVDTWQSDIKEPEAKFTELLHKIQKS